MQLRIQAEQITSRKVNYTAVCSSVGCSWNGAREVSIIGIIRLLEELEAGTKEDFRACKDNISHMADTHLRIREGRRLDAPENWLLGWMNLS